MKALFAFFGLLVLSQAALANQRVYTYRTVLVEQSKPGRICPQLVSTTAVDEKNALRGHSVMLTDANGVSNVFAYQYTTRSCKSDIVCESTHHYAQPGSLISVSMKLENDGQYPTTDLPGYTSLQLSWNTGDSDTSKYCTYMFF